MGQTITRRSTADFMALDTQAPAWLQRQWTPRETFDPTPWLQDRYARQIDAQVIPLKIQGMQLQNQAEQLHIEHQAMQNEQAGMEMQDYKDQLPAAAEWFKKTRGNPQAMLDTPIPTGVTHPKLQQQILNAQQNAAQTTWGQTYQRQQIANTQLAAFLHTKGVDTTSAFQEGPFGPEGPNKWDSAELAKLSDQYLTADEKRQLRLIYGRQEHYYDEFGNPIYGRGGAGYSPDVTEKQALALQRARTALNDAIDNGEPDDVIQEKAAFLSDLQKAQGRQHRDPIIDEQVRALRSELAIVQKEYYQQGDTSPNQQKKKAQLKSDIERIQGEIRRIGGGSEATAAPATQSGKSFKWTPGGIVPK